MDFNEGGKALWNFDGAEAVAIFELKAKFVMEMKDWKLEEGYWTLRTLRMELDSMFSRGRKKRITMTKEDDEREKAKLKTESEKQEIDRLLKELETERNTFLIADKDSPEIRSRFFLVLEAFYMKLCLLMKKHGMYFREGESEVYSILKR